MTAFRIALNRVSKQGGKLFSSARRLPKELKITALARRIGGRKLIADDPPADLDELKSEFLRAAYAGTLYALHAPAWDRLPAVLWYGAGPQLGDISEILSGLQSHLAMRRANRCIRRMILCYFREFQASSPGFQQFAGILCDALRSRHGPSGWLSCHDTFGIFNPSKGPASIAHYCIETTSNIQDALAAASISGAIVAMRFGLATLYAGLDRFSEIAASGGKTNIACEKISDWLAIRTTTVPLEIESQVYLANALLSPWGASQPDETVRKVLVEILLQYVGDPRRGDAVWQLPQTADVKPRLLGWLAYGTIEEFFAVIDASAKAGHWNDRRTFWASYAEKGAITDAWVAYGPVALRLAKRAAHVSALAFGELKNARLRDHSALLLRIGPLVVADYSHDGSCRFYTSEADQPEFYRDSYNDNDLRQNAVDALPHQGGWQWKFAFYIRRVTGIRSSYEGSW